MRGYGPSLNSAFGQSVGQGLGTFGQVFGSVFIGFSKREIPFSEVLSSFGNGWTSLGQHLATFGQQSTRFQPLRDAIPSILSATCPTLLQDHPHSLSPLASTFSFPEETRGLLGPLVTYWHSLDRHQEPQHLHVIAKKDEQQLGPLEHLFPSRAQATFSGPSTDLAPSRSPARVRQPSFRL